MKLANLCTGIVGVFAMCMSLTIHTPDIITGILFLLIFGFTVLSFSLAMKD